MIQVSFPMVATNGPYAGMIGHNDRPTYAKPTLEAPYKPERGQQRVVCSAVRYSGGFMLIGPRHYDDTMRKQMDDLGIEGSEECPEQGFIDQHGVFLTREEAWVIASAANQVIFRCGGDGEKLYSENLY